MCIMKTTHSFRRGFVLAVIVAFFGAGPAMANDAIVPEEYPTIQAAVDFCPDKDGDGIRTIIVLPGTYHENVVIRAQNSHLQLIGDDPVATQVVGAGTHPTLKVRGATDVTVRGLAFSGEGLAPGIAVLNSSRVRIELNIIRHNKVGIYAHRVEESIIRSNDLRSNAGTGLRLREGRGNKVLLNMVRLNEGIGIAIRESSENEVVGNTVWNNGYEGIASGFSHHNRFIENLVMSSGGNGIFFLDAEYEVVSRNLGFDNGKSGLKIMRSGDITVSGNRFISNERYGILCRRARDCDFDAVQAGIQPLPGRNDLAGNLKGEFLEG